ncbi:hypothetical protein OP10G_4358 [Fimbriimonas ginsengisoli Gsoil 348]|uniref:Uncharacterized protein n=1 Tax=Fimbriimonas ginsengisoli Gsoil 348 TaxID=661478 RepID=A0A068NW98_FIMGI|nr:hypothetical protein OP10G_4358 [Fimbriimonas ginsengisoli Gsoil 348]
MLNKVSGGNGAVSTLIQNWDSPCQHLLLSGALRKGSLLLF